MFPIIVPWVGEEDILWDKGMLGHKGFDTQNWELLDLLSKNLQP